MAFFDNFGKKASQSTTKAIQKAQDYSEIAKINSLITEEEEKINSTYYKIGKLYVSAHDEESEKLLAELVSSISDREKKIREYRTQIQIIKGIKCCTKCGTEAPIGAAFCSACGTLLPKIEVKVNDDTIKCQYCGTILKSDMRFCTSCGKPVKVPPAIEIHSSHSIKEAQKEKVCQSNSNGTEPGNDFSIHIGAPVPTSDTVENQPSISAEEKAKEIICPSCGEKIEAGNIYCTECGAKL